MPETTAAPTTEPATEPTLSAEELFVQSLPEAHQQAYELGIVDLPLLEEPERSCSIQEAAELLQRIYRIKFGSDSWMVTNAVTEENAADPTTRGWFMTMMYAADAESLVGVDESKDYAANLRKLTYTQQKYGTDLADALLGELTNTGYVLIEKENDIPDRYISAYGEYAGAAKEVTDRKDFDGDIVIVSYAITRYDRRSGEKLMTWDAEKKLHFQDVMPVRDVVETGLRYFYALETKDTVPCEELTYDTAIITPELLNRETTLPDASSSHLPPQWHGITYTYSAKLEEIPFENEIQAIHDAGFNFLRYSLNFTHFYGFLPEEGRMHEGRLKELDQLLAWCMERDIHLNLAMYWNYDWPGGLSSYSFPKQTKYIQSIADTWQALARRYTGIPSNYLSFTLLDHAWGSNDEDYANFLYPSAEAIWDVSPDRCVIARVGQDNITGSVIAAKGVALTSPCTWCGDFIVNTYKDPGPTMEKAVWPSEVKGEQIDANIALSKDLDGKSKTAPDTIAAIAEENGVGYMVYEWGPRAHYYGLIVDSVRYSDEALDAYFADMTKTMAERGYGWNYTDWMGNVGLTFCSPLVKDSTYTKMEGHSLYIDEEMAQRFRSINNIP